ncbi:transcriptional regulator, partial [bacterium]
MTTGATSERTPAAALGEQIKGLRASRRIGLAEAARRANVAKSTLSDWEHGRKSPSGPALERLLDSLDADSRLRAHLLVDANPGYARWALGDLALGVPVHVGRMLRALRIRLGLTQSGVASRVGVTQSAVAKWESGDSRLEGTALHNVCFALGASPEECTAITTAREPASGGAEDLDYIERRWEIERLPPRLRPVMRLG